MLGTFFLEGIPPAPIGVPKIEVVFTLDTNGILQVHAKEDTSGKSSSVTIRNESGRLSEAEIAKMLDDADRYKAEDSAEIQRIKAKQGVDNYLLQCEGILTDERFEGRIPIGF